MLRSIKTFLLCGVLAVLAPSAFAFSLHGPTKGYQTAAIGYQRADDIGGPMGLTEGYRWNVPQITYAFDQSFILYFGTNGMKAVDDAFKILNAVPNAAAMSADLSEFPTRTHAENYEAGVLGIIDLKSRVLSMVVEQMGLASPERWVFALRARAVQNVGGVVTTNYTVIRQNYDPVTLQPSSYVNTSLYTYTIQDPTPLGGADAVEGLPLFDDDGVPDLAVASGFLPPGLFFRGLTRDDMGGFKFLFRANNLAWETPITGVAASTGFGGSVFTGGWVPFFGTTNLFGTNAVATNSFATNFITTGIRGGIGKVTFKKVFFDSLIGQTFKPITNQFTESVVDANVRLIKQRAERAITQPDILFVVEDLGIDPVTLVPIPFTRTPVTWINNDGINGVGVAGGPGVIEGPIRITFTDQYPYYANVNPGFLGEDPSARSALYGSFDETTNAPIIYPSYLNLTIQDIRRILGLPRN